MIKLIFKTFPELKVIDLQVNRSTTCPAQWVKGKINRCVTVFQSAEHRGDPEIFQREHITSQQRIENRMTLESGWQPSGALGFWEYYFQPGSHQTVCAKCEDKGIFQTCKAVFPFKGGGAIRPLSIRIDPSGDRGRMSRRQDTLFLFPQCLPWFLTVKLFKNYFVLINV